MQFISERLKKLSGILTESNTEQLKEDWENYQSLEEIEIKYLEKIMLAIGISISDERLPRLREIFKTALKDAETLGQMNNSTSNSLGNETLTDI